MHRIYKTPKDIIMAEEVENTDLTVKLITALDSKEYVMIKWQEEVNIYHLSLVGQVTEIADDISFEEYRDITYAKLDQELLDQGIEPRRLDCIKFLTTGENPSLLKSDKVLMEIRGDIIHGKLKK